MDIRIGQGFDVHRFADAPVEGRMLILGGVAFPGEPTLVGHSDGDAVAHAIADALLGAAQLGDIGQHYPDTDPKWKGADCMAILADVVAKIAADGWSVANVDCNVVCEAPKIAPMREQMQTRLTEVVGAPVTVKGRRAEGLGAIGRREGLMCLASALLIRGK